MVYREMDIIQEQTPIPGFPSGSWTAHNVASPPFRTPTYLEVESVLNADDRKLPAQIVMDYEHIRQLPRLLSMVEAAVKLERLYLDDWHGNLHCEDYYRHTMDVAVNSFLNTATHRAIWLRLYDERAAPPPLIERHYTGFENLAVAAIDQPPTVLGAEDEHAVHRFLRITLDRLRNSPSSNYPHAPFAPGDMEVILELPRNEFPFPDPSNPREPFQAYDAVRYLHKYTEIFRENLRLSFTIRPSLTATFLHGIGQPSQGSPPGTRGTVTPTTLNRIQQYKQMRHNDPNFRLTGDNTLV